VPQAVALTQPARICHRAASPPGKRSREIVAYCRGTYCVLSFEAVAMLRGRGFKARRLEDGFPEWRAAGLPVAGGSV
jgi:rhodanese-related sulfurtransferase